jgi:GT2 family glycosyltransferase
MSADDSPSTIGIAISTRNRAEALRRCLDSLAAGRVLPDEVVVADQSDGVDTKRVVEEARDGALRVSYVRARPGGLGVAQNDAVAATRSAIVAVLDDDCVAADDWLATIASAFAKDRELALLAGRVLPLGPPRADAYAVSSRVSPKAQVFVGKNLPWHVGSGNNFAVRREWFERIGGCDERLGPGAPLRGGLDMDLFYRLLRAGARARYEPEVLVFHERATRAGRLARRPSYGFGMAAAIGIWLRDGDRFAWRVLGAWIRLRGSLLLRALARGRWQTVREEALVLRGTLQGLLRALSTTRGEGSPR